LIAPAPKLHNVKNNGDFNFRGQKKADLFFRHEKISCNFVFRREKISYSFFPEQKISWGRPEGGGQFIFTLWTAGALPIFFFQLLTQGTPPEPHNGQK
jgi:hypothetical protein